MTCVRAEAERNTNSAVVQVNNKTVNYTNINKITQLLLEVELFYFKH